MVSMICATSESGPMIPIAIPCSKEIIAESDMGLPPSLSYLHHKETPGKSHSRKLVKQSCLCAAKRLPPLMKHRAGGMSH
jgi:hypothetical protein